MWLLEPDSLVNIAHLSKFYVWWASVGTLGAGDAPKHGVWAAVAVADPPQPTACPLKRHVADRERALLCWPSDDTAFEKINFPPRLGLMTSNRAVQNCRPESSGDHLWWRLGAAFAGLFLRRPGRSSLAGSRLNWSERDDADNDWQDAGTG